MDKLEAELKIAKILEENPDVWKTVPEFFSYIRGGIRRGLWEKHPVKLKLLKKKRKQIPNPNPNGKKATVWGCTCELCGEDKVVAEIQIDHISNKNYSLKSIDDIQDFFESIVLVTEEDLRPVCKWCNSCMVLANREGITYEKAVIKKQIIQICKDNMDVAKLQELGVTQIPTSAARRRALLENLLL